MTVNLPPNLVVRDKVWHFDHQREWQGIFRVQIRRQRFADLHQYFSLGVLVYRWWDRMIVIQVGSHSLMWYRLRETTGVPT